VDARKNTPCTFPETKQRTQIVIGDFSIGSIQPEKYPIDFSRIKQGVEGGWRLAVGEIKLSVIPPTVNGQLLTAHRPME
jgi:hypothetical protein